MRRESGKLNRNSRAGGERPGFLIVGSEGRCRDPVGESQDLPEVSPSAALTLPQGSWYVRCFGDLGQLCTVVCGFL
jgi:hypothetical protein